MLNFLNGIVFTIAAAIATLIYLEMDIYSNKGFKENATCCHQRRTEIKCNEIVEACKDLENTISAALDEYSPGTHQVCKYIIIPPRIDL